MDEEKEIREEPAPFEVTPVTGQKPVQLQDPELAKALKTQEEQEDGMSEAILEGLLFIVGDDGITAAQAANALEISE